MKVTARARVREDRAGDPLDGLVNLFDIGIILSVGFLLAALSSMDLTQVITNPEKAQQPAKVPADSVLAKPDDTVEQIEIPPGEEVVGRGEPIGQLYRLKDGRTIVVKPGGSGGAADSGTTGTPGVTGTPAAPGTSTAPSTPGTTTPPTTP